LKLWALLQKEDAFDARPHGSSSKTSPCSQVVNTTVNTDPKAPATPTTMSKQHCRMLQVEGFFRQSRNKLSMFSWFWLCQKNEILRWTRLTSLPFSATMSNIASVTLLPVRTEYKPLFYSPLSLGL